ncbi:MAG: Na/Pi symporter [Candidatus Omnitrophica bacterium]|nr:Na/Pi symporter [Candidatus Omnitrophota bacterium]
MNKKTIQLIWKLTTVAAFVYLFLVSITLMGVSLKGFGAGFTERLLETTSNPFVGLFIGILTTSIIQSSSTTTSIVVGMVASGVITISNAIPIVMGANIGTTATNTIVSLSHITRKEEFKRAITGATVHDFFNITCVAIMFPIELATGFLQKAATWLSSLFVNFGGIKFTSPIKTATKPTCELLTDLCTKNLHLSEKMGYITLLLLSVFLIFLSLYMIVKVMKSLVIKQTETVLDKIIGRHGIIGIIAGLIFTMIVQSSSITTALLIPLIGAGILTVELAFPVTLGANIGTTTTAILASFATGNSAAITIAFVHFIFNVTGVLIIYPIKIFRLIPIKLAKGLGNLAFKKRRYAIIYAIGIFYILPTIMILISRMFN